MSLSRAGNTTAGFAPAHRAYISVGSNLGDKLAYCRHAVACLAQLDGTHVTAVSKIYRTAPVDYQDQNWFVNLALAIETVLAPDALLAALKRIQRSAGQGEKSIRFGPRRLDLDILLYGRQIIQTPLLTVPHPRMHRRRFVLKPLCEIDPGLVHPVRGESVRTLLNRLDPGEQQIEEIKEDVRTTGFCMP